MTRAFVEPNRVEPNRFDGARREQPPRRRTSSLALAMDTVSRLLAKFIPSHVSIASHVTTTSALSDTSPSSSRKIHPRRLSFAFGASPSSGDRARAFANAHASTTTTTTTTTTRFASNERAFNGDLPSGKRARAREETLEANGGDAKRARSLATTATTTARDVSARDWRQDLSWPSAKRKRIASEGVSDVDARAHAMHRQKTSESASRAATATARETLSRATPSLVVNNVLPRARVDRTLPSMPNRVVVAATTTETRARARGGTAARRGTLRRPRRGSDAMVSIDAEFTELASDLAERERAEANRAPALALAPTFTFGAASASDAAKPRLALGAPTANGALASVSAPTTTAISAFASDSSANARAGGFTFGAPASASASASTFSFGAAPAASAALPNPFASKSLLSLASATTASTSSMSHANPFASNAFAVGASSAGAAPAGERRVVRARRPTRK